MVLKFGGSSVSNNENLKLVANKIIEFVNKDKKVVVILSAQGKTTDKLIKEAEDLSKEPNKREQAMLLTTGEQVSIAKLGILLNDLGYPAISLTAWQAGIKSSKTAQNAIIESINPSRILEELDNGNIVIIAGFQGINDKYDISTLGRGGSDTTAVAVSAAIEADKCYIYSDVDGVYTADPNKVKNVRKLKNISYDEMLEISNEGAKVLHNRCIEIGEKFEIPIITKSTFNNKEGTIISKKIEENTIKSVVKKEVSKISIVGNGIIRNNKIIKDVIDILQELKLEILNIEISEYKICVIFKEIVNDSVLEKIHNKIFTMYN